LIEDLDDVYYLECEVSKDEQESEEGSFVTKTGNLNIK